MNKQTGWLSDELLIAVLFVMLAAVTLLDQLQATPLVVVLQTVLALALLVCAAIIIRRRANTVS